MRILHVISSTDPSTGGPIEVVNTLSDVWERHGHVSHTVSLDQPNAPWLSRMGERVTALGVSGPLINRLPGRGYAFSPKLAPWLQRHSSDYDTAIVHGLWNYASVGGWRGLHGSSLPYFVFVHGMLDPWFLRAYPWRAKAKALFWRTLEHRVLHGAEDALFTTEEERRLAAQSFRPYKVNGLVVGLGARDLVAEPSHARDAFLAATPSVRGRRFALFLGRIHPKKGLDLLLKAFARLATTLSDLDLVIAGPDHVGLQPQLAGLAERLGVSSRTHWPGMLTGAAKVGAFQSSAFFVLPSHQENFGIAVAESLACSTPVLITDKVNIWPSIATDQAGIVVTDSVDAIEGGLRHLANLDPAQHGAMRRQARLCFVNRFEIERVSLDLLDTLERRLQNGAMPTRA